MRGIELEEVHQERDIGVIIHNSLKPSVQCAEVARRASAVLGQITRSFTFRDKKNLFAPVYSICVLPLGVCRLSMVPLDPGRYPAPGKSSNAGSKTDNWVEGIDL